MFNGLWPAFDEAEVPITSITNGVHAPTWVAREVFELANKAGADTDSDAADVWNVVDRIPSADLWSTKRDLRARLVEDARGRLRKSCLKRGAAPAELGWIDTALDPDVLTIGFARRAASYKRLTLMLSDPERLKKLLLHPERPIQLVMAGKAHPADDGGKKLIQAIVQLADDPEVRHRVAYLPNYDIAMAQPLYPGCDVWLNNPLRPYEACGTSGMKAALNGGLNLSILDGWWDEWYDGNNGWAIPSADGVEDPDKRDDIEANALYDLIEKEVAPRFYDLDGEGLPTRWIEMVRHTLKSLGPKVLSTRMVREYVERPLRAGGRRVAGDERLLRGCRGARCLEGPRRRGLVLGAHRPRRDRGPLRRPRARRRHGPARLRLARVRHHLGAAAVLRRPRHPGRRPPQDRERPRRTADRSWPALPARLLPPAVLPRGLAAGDLPGARPRRAADHAPS